LLLVEDDEEELVLVELPLSELLLDDPEDSDFDSDFDSLFDSEPFLGELEPLE